MTGPVQRLVDALTAGGFNPHQNGTSHAARCPGHDDAVASLSISEGKDGREPESVRVGSHTRRDTERIIGRIDLGDGKQG